MIFSAADQTAMIAAIGETVTHSALVDDEPVLTSITGDFRLESRPLEMGDGSVMSSAPTLRITDAVKVALSIDIDTTITARSVNYKVAEPPFQEQSGLWLLILTKA